MDQDAIKKERKILMNLYGLFAVSILLTVMPHWTAAVLSLFFFIALLAMAYTMRGTSDEGSLVHNHTTFIIRTIWMSGLVAFISVGLGSAYLVQVIDHMPLLPCTDMMATAAKDGQNPTTTDVFNMIEPCLFAFFESNGKEFIIAAIITIVPVMIYVVWRFISGFVRAFKGYRIAHPEAWF